MAELVTPNNNIELGDAEVNVFDTIHEATHWLALQIIADASNVKVGKLSVALSGGNSPVSLFRNLVNASPDGVELRPVLWFWGDERCVHQTDSQSNFKLADDNFFSKIPFNYAYAFRVWGEDEPIEESKRYQRVVTGILPLVNNTPQFDIVILGMGADGHTASLFPDRMDILESTNLFVNTIHPETLQNRISATYKLINNAKKIYFIVGGAEKADLVASILHKRNNFEAFPSSHIKPHIGKTVWLLDNLAASML